MGLNSIFTTLSLALDKLPIERHFLHLEMKISPIPQVCCELNGIMYIPPHVTSYGPTEED